MEKYFFVADQKVSQTYCEFKKKWIFCAERHCFSIYTYIFLHWMYFILIKVENCTNKHLGEIFLDGRTENYFERQFKQNDGPHASVILRVLICFTCSLYLWPKFVDAHEALRNHCRQCIHIFLRMIDIQRF